MKPHLILLILLLSPLPATAVQLDYYLPKESKYDPAVSTPQDFLKFAIGSRHVRHHELVQYLQRVSTQSERVELREYARTHGGRPLVVATITSPENHRRLDSIQKDHLRLANPARSAGVDLDELPAVIWMGYSVHGNEASAGNAAPLLAYWLAAAEGDDVESLLDDVVILLDPCLNPEGFDRFAQWVNSHRGRTLNADARHREHVEPFPSGRTNYYWFDLNRDWLPAQHPESRGRLAIYGRWLPNVVLDFHEMSSSATFFFQPGIPARTNPLTPQSNVELTRRFGDYHAQALDRLGSLYFTEERFDDFYMGKGSTYPDLHGGIGILFEQASSRGHVQDTTNGRLTFPFTIRNQVATSFSSLQATQETRLQLLQYKRQFYLDAGALARNADIQGYIVSAGSDQARMDEFVGLLRRHRIRAFRLARDMEAAGQHFAQQTAIVIPAQQPEYLFLTSLFETRTTFEENIFYDVSAWTLPEAFDLNVAALHESPEDELLGEPVSSSAAQRGKVSHRNAYAYLLDWRDYFAPRALYRLLAAEIQVKAAKRSFKIAGRQFGYGTLMVPIGTQPKRLAKIRKLIDTIVTQDLVDVVPVKTGLTEQGIDLGSSYFETIQRPRILLVVGSGASTYESGEVWHLLDYRFRVPVTMVDNHRLGSVDLDDYNTVVIVSGRYSLISESATRRLDEWIEGGGTLIAIGSAVRWASQSELVTISYRSHEAASQDAEPQDAALQDRTEDKPQDRRPYASAADDQALDLVKGTIFKTLVDQTHPVCYGYEDQELPVFRSQSFFVDPTDNVYSTPVVYAPQPLISGYISQENLKLAGGSASVLVDGSGSGRVIMLVDNPNFRAHWYGTNRLFLNSVFFGSIIREP